MRLVLAAACLAVALVGCSDPAPADDVAGSGACGPVETIPIQGEGHLVGDQEPPVPYNSTPPTSGWHSSGDVPFEVSSPDAPLTEPEQVTVLELGGVVISYNGLDEADVAALAELVTGEFAGQAALTPYDGLSDGQVAHAAWGKLQVCDAADPEAAAAFITAHAEASG